MRHRRHRRLGLTLVEIMIVIVIIALASTGVVYSVGALTRTKLRASAMRVQAAARFARHRALTQGRTVRVVFDLDTESMGIEEADSRVTLARGGEDDGEDDEAVDPWASAQALLENPDEPALGASSFAQITDEDGDPLPQYAIAPLDGVRILRFVTDHEPMPREHGRVAFYFFPNGTGERSYVELADARDNELTVEIEPISGRGRVHGPEFDLEDIEARRPRDPG